MQKRPFARPLLLWIAGIIVGTKVPVCETFIIGCLVFVVFLLLVSLFSPYESYDFRFYWGFIWSGLCFALAVIYAAYCLHVGFVSFAWKTLLVEWASAWQELIVDKIYLLEVETDVKSVLAALVIGFKKYMPFAIRHDYASAGVAHVLAVSGFHVAIVASFISKFLSFLPNTDAGRILRLVLSVGIVWVFVCITGLAASSVRAGIMFTMYALAHAIAVNTDKYNVLYATAFLMLVYNPLYLYDVGFQLSFLAVLSIMLFYTPVRNLIVLRNPIVGYFWDIMAVTFAAQVGTQGLCLYYFKEFSLVFLFSTIPAIFLSTVLIPLCLLWLCLPVDLLLSLYIQRGIEWLAGIFVDVVEICAGMDLLIFPTELSAGMTFLYYLMVLCFFLYIRRRRGFV